MNKLKGKLKPIRWLVLLWYLIPLCLTAQTPVPGGVSSGTVNGFRIDHYEGNYGSNPNAFGSGSSNNVPTWFGYTGRISGNELYAYDNTHFALEYSAKFTITNAGTYTFSTGKIDDNFWLYIDGVLVCSGSSALPTSGSKYLSSGTHDFKAKFVNYWGPILANLDWQGPDVPTKTEFDGRFAFVPNARLTGWYNSSNVNTFKPAANITAVQGFKNLAPAFINTGNLKREAAGYIELDEAATNYNPAAVFNGDDAYASRTPEQKGLVMRNGSQTVFTVYQPINNLNGSHWVFGRAGDCGANQAWGIWKNNGTAFSSAVAGNSSAAATSTFTQKEPKLLAAQMVLNTGANASPLVNASAAANGNAWSSPTPLHNQTYLNQYGLEWGQMCGSFTSTAYLPELIYYPFKLTDLQVKKVQTYLGIKYGIKLEHDYIASNGDTVFKYTFNAGYTNRVFGIGRDQAGALNQKQSKSQMASASHYDFLAIAKGPIAKSNAQNTAVIPNNTFVMVGDNDGAMVVQTNEIPSTLTGCTYNRLGREWKFQVKGAMGPITIQAGSDATNGYRIPGQAAGVVLLIDTDNDGDFSTGTITTVEPTSLARGIARFENVNIAHGNVITFAWIATSPGGVATGLNAWFKADDPNMQFSNATTKTISQWSDASSVGRNVTTGGGAPTLQEKSIGYMPSVYMPGNAWFSFGSGQTTFSSAFTSGEVFSVNKTLSTTTQRGYMYHFGGTQNPHYTWDNGAIYATFGTSDRLGWNPQTGAIIDGKPGISGIQKTFNPLEYHIVGNYSSASVWGYRVNGDTVAHTGSNALSFSTSVAHVGASPGYPFFGNIPEIILYNRVLNPTERKQVESYLAVKYGLSLEGSIINYVMSDGQNFYTHDSVYKHHIFGIGRDDCSGVYVKQSKYAKTGDNVSIGLLNIEPIHDDNKGTIPQNKRFLMVSNNGLSFSGITTNIPAAYTVCNPMRYERSWKVQNTNSMGVVQVRVGDKENRVSNAMTNPTLAVDIDGDGNMATGTVVLYTTNKKVVNGMAIFDNVSLPHGAVFTLLWNASAPGGVVRPTSTANGDAVTIGGVSYARGMTHKFYSSTDNNLGDGITGTLLATNYVSNPSGFHYISNAINFNNFAAELSAMMYIPSTSSGYQLRFTSLDDYGCIIIDDTMRLNVAAPVTCCLTHTTPSIFLSQGYHKIVIRASDVSGPENFNVEWNGGSGSTFSAMPDSIFYTQILGPSGWYSSKDNFFDDYADGTNMSTAAKPIWPDLSMNQNDLTCLSGHNPLFYNKNAKHTKNTNPSVKFSDDYIYRGPYLNGFAYGQQGRSLFTVASATYVNASDHLTAYGEPQQNNGMFGLSIVSGNLHLYGWANNQSQTGFLPNTQTTPRWNLMNGTYRNVNLPATTNAFLYADGKQLSTGNKNWFNRFSQSTQLSIGFQHTSPIGDNWNNNVSEVVYYPWDLSPTERKKVESYLAATWGQTLDQGIPTNYIASNGSAMWNASLNGNFKYDITVMGRDDCGAFNQTRVTSTDEYDIVSMSLGGGSNGDPNDTTIFTNDMSFISYSRDSVLNPFSNFSTNIPPSLASIACYFRLNRVWQVQVVGSQSTVAVQAGKSRVFEFGPSTYRPVLLISTSSSDFSNATIKHADSIYKGRAYFSNVTFTHGQYFTFGFIQAAPGGVYAGLKTWFNAGAGAFSDIEQDNPITEDGSSVMSLNNIALGNTFNTVQQSSLPSTPTYRISKFNFNPSITFDGVNDRLVSTVPINTNDYRSSTQLTSIMAAANYGTGGQNVFWFTSDGSNNATKTAMERPQCFWNSGTPFTRTPTLTVPEIYSWTATVGGSSVMYSNLKNVGTNSMVGSSSATYNLHFYLGGPSYNGNWGFFDMGEFVTYADNKGAVTTPEMRRLHSYFALKYGYTLDATAMGNQYVSSKGTSYYDYTNYWNRITGIGRDDCSALEQKQSLSMEAGKLVTLALGSQLFPSNKENTNKFSNDNSWEVFGDNNKSNAWSGTDAPGNIDAVRLARVWRVKETGPIDTVLLKVYDNMSSKPAGEKLPVTSEVIYLLVAKSNSGGKFKNTNPVVVPMVFDSEDSSWSVTYNFQDGEYFTFGTKKLPVGPAGISDGLTTWYHASDLPVGALANNSATLVNRANEKYTLTRNNQGAASTLAGAANQFNFNRHFTFSGNANFEKFNLTQDEIIGTKEGSMYAVGLTAHAVHGVARNSNTVGTNSGIGSSFTPASINVYFNNKTLALPNAGVANTPNIYGYTAKAGTSDLVMKAFTNGTMVSSTQATTTRPAATDYLYKFADNPGYGFYNNKLAETFTYDRELKDYEIKVLNSYLAIKYGQNLTHNFYSANFEGENESQHIIYNIATYPHRVFGVGIDSVGGLLQKQSTSQLSGSMLKMFLLDSLKAENNANTGTFPKDRSYVLAGDNDGSIAAWASNLPTPASFSSECSTPMRLARVWKITATGKTPSVTLAIPDNSSTEATKLPALPAGSTLYMVVNENENFSINANQELIPMTFDAVSKNWTGPYGFLTPKTVYMTFLVKDTNTALTPVALANGEVVASQATCNSTNYRYFKGNVPTNTKDNAVIAMNFNGNTLTPQSVVVDNQGALFGGGNTFSNTGAGYYQSTDGTQTIRISKRMHSIKAPGSYTSNGGVVVRVYYTDADTIAMFTDAMPGGATIQEFGWFKDTAHNASTVVSHMVAGDLKASNEITPIAYGTEAGVKYVEFLLNDFSTIGYYAKTTSGSLNYVDTDGDGIPDTSDTDDDNDGIPDTSDTNPLDTDNDGVPNSLDDDDDGDGIVDSQDPSLLDTDNDGIKNNTDPDDDNDGIADSSDTNPLDSDNDGQNNDVDDDDDNDGILDIDEMGTINPTTGTYTLPDTDGDGIADVLDPADTDGDGIPDSTDTDDDGDGLADNEDPMPLDTDNDGIDNIVDTDDDGDGIADATDTMPLDTDNDGMNNDVDTDDDNDGIADSTEQGTIDPLTGHYTLPDEDGDGLPDLADIEDTDGDGVPNNTDTDDDGDGIPDATDSMPLDTDNDGLANNVDPDDDNDGIQDKQDPYPIDTDNDGTYNQTDADDDGDGIDDSTDANPFDSDNDGITNDLDTDDDNDGVSDSGEMGSIDPVTGTYTLPDADGDGLPDLIDVNDTDGDGIADGSDTDDDGDGIPDAQDQYPLDTDNDGIPNVTDTDDDGDGIADATDTMPFDTDNDGVKNDADTDDDGDGIADTIEQGTIDPNTGFYTLPDSDGDGLPDLADINDTDGDGIADNVDTDDDGDGIPDTSDTHPLDTDNDGIPNATDTDDDGDGIPDGLDPSAIDSDNDGIKNDVDTDDDGDGIPDTSDTPGIDSDNDGINNEADTDDDNDGIPDSTEQGSLDPNTGTFTLPDSDGDGTPDLVDIQDTDGDGIADNSDTDDDGDGLPDASDPYPLDTDNDGIPNATDTDDDGDGIPDTTDTMPFDTDNDGQNNDVDTDDDNDGIADIDEQGTIDPNTGTYTLPDSDGDGIPDLADIADTDEDGIADNLDTDDDGDGIPDTSDSMPLDTDNDGIPNVTDTDDDGDGIADNKDPKNFDSDNDGQRNDVDLDDDADGIIDDNDTGGIDTDNDGQNNEIDTDDDNDGIPDAQEIGALDSNTSKFTLPDGDNDGIPDLVDNGSIPLPILMEYFTGVSDQCDVTLTWKTAAEINFKAFEVEYSHNGSQFVHLTTIPVKGAGSVYSYQHTTTDRVSVYRLKQVDLNDKYSYSKTVSLQTSCTNRLIDLYPNPATDVINIKMKDYTGDAIGTLFNSLGEVVLTNSIVAGVAQFNVSHLPNGTYHYVINTSDYDKQVIKVVIQH